MTTEHATRSGFERVQYDAFDRRIQGIENATQALTGLVNSLAQSHALFEYKTDQAYRVSEKLETLVEKINERGDAQLDRFDQMLDDRELRLKESIAQHKEVLLLEIINKTKDVGDMKTRLTKLEETVETLKKIIWVAMGGAAVVSFVIEKIFSLVS